MLRFGLAVVVRDLPPPKVRQQCYRIALGGHYGGPATMPFGLWAGKQQELCTILMFYSAEIPSATETSFMSDRLTISKIESKSTNLEK